MWGDLSLFFWGQNESFLVIHVSPHTYSVHRLAEKFKFTITRSHQAQSRYCCGVTPVIARSESISLHNLPPLYFSSRDWGVKVEFRAENPRSLHVSGIAGMAMPWAVSLKCPRTHPHSRCKVSPRLFQGSLHPGDPAIQLSIGVYRLCLW